MPCSMAKDTAISTIHAFLILSPLVYRFHGNINCAKNKIMPKISRIFLITGFSCIHISLIKTAPAKFYFIYSPENTVLWKPRTEFNRLFPRSSHMVKKHTCWLVSCTVGIPKQRQVKVDRYELLCFGSATAQLAHQHVWFCTMWLDRAKGLFRTLASNQQGSTLHVEESLLQENRSLGFDDCKCQRLLHSSTHWSQ